MISAKWGLVTRFWALTRAENSKTYSISSKTSAADAGAAPASAAEVLEEIEHVFEFSARVKAQIVVTGFWIFSPVFHREPSLVKSRQ